MRKLNQGWVMLKEAVEKDQNMKTNTNIAAPASCCFYSSDSKIEQELKQLIAHKSTNLKALICITSYGKRKTKRTDKEEKKEKK